MYQIAIYFKPLFFAYVVLVPLSLTMTCNFRSVESPPNTCLAGWHKLKEEYHGSPTLMLHKFGSPSVKDCSQQALQAVTRTGGGKRSHIQSLIKAECYFQ